MQWDLEELATHVLEAKNVSVPVDADLLAGKLELRVEDGGPTCTGGLFEGGLILVNDAERPERRAFIIAHEIAHYLLQLRGWRDSHDAVNYLAAALLLPREDFERDLRRWGWDLLRLHARHRWASWEVIARRICALREARMFVFDRPLQGQTPAHWYSVPWGLRPSELERDACGEAIRWGARVDIYPGITAWPVLEHHWHRVITIATNESLSCLGLI
jgi:uncharacterized protein DUF955